MSSVPPNMPPGGFPPYDPKTQWRIHREQQRAAWRAQRDAWRAQRHAWKANYVGAYGPRVPSLVGPIILVCVGVIALLLMTGHIDADSFWSWYGRWWPLLLIGAGLGLLGEWTLDMRRATPVRRSGGFIGILILLAIVGGIASVHNHFVNGFNGPFGDNDFFSNFGMPEHDSDQPTDSITIPANAAIEIENPRGDISITAGDQPTLVVAAHEVAYANSDNGAKKIFDQEAMHVTVSGNAVLIKSESNSRGRVNLTVTVPKTAKVTVNHAMDNVTAAGLGAGFEVTARGDIHLSSIVGPVEAHFINGKHDEFSAHDIQGDLTLDGDLNDLTLSEIKGAVTQNGEILGDVHMESISGAIHLHTPVTELQLGELPGDLTLGNDDLRVTEAKGPVHVVSHSKDIDLSEIYGDIYVEDRNGRIAVEPAGAYGVEARNNKGDVEITLPSDDSATVNGRTHNGDIVSDFSLAVSGDEDKTVNGKIGSGTARIVLNTDNGDLRIKKGPTAAAMPTAAANSPDTQAGKHLKSKKSLPEQPVAQ
jgi:DUF4097 and DUF4098 domain-containing protein YvlB